MEFHFDRVNFPCILCSQSFHFRLKTCVIVVSWCWTFLSDFCFEMWSFRKICLIFNPQYQRLLLHVILTMIPRWKLGVAVSDPKHSNRWIWKTLMIFPGVLFHIIHDAFRICQGSGIFGSVHCRWFVRHPRCGNHPRFATGTSFLLPIKFVSLVQENYFNQSDNFGIIVALVHWSPCMERTNFLGDTFLIKFLIRDSCLMNSFTFSV